MKVGNKGLLRGAVDALHARFGTPVATPKPLPVTVRLGGTAPIQLWGGDELEVQSLFKLTVEAPDFCDVQLEVARAQSDGSVEVQGLYNSLSQDPEEDDELLVERVIELTGTDAELDELDELTLGELIALAEKIEAQI